MATPKRIKLFGCYRVRSRVTDDKGNTQPIDLGTLRVARAIEEDVESEPGQWSFILHPDEGGNHREAWLIRIASRLGLLPVRFTQAFEQVLRNHDALCLVADTNALYHGTLAQAVSLRAGRATHVAIADQAMMEMQRQRERAHVPKVSSNAQARSRPSPAQAAILLSPGPAVNKAVGQIDDEVQRWSLASQRSAFLSAGSRALKRLRAGGHIVHIARPPEAMVRYFGGSRSGAESSGDADDSQKDLVGSNALRDRLVLESVFQQRVNLPGVPVWLVTDDALLAEQAYLEGLSVGFGWLASNINPPVLSSPFIHPRLLKIHHISVYDFLDEMLWCSGSISLQKEGTGSEEEMKTPNEGRERLLATMGSSDHFVERVSHKHQDPWFPRGSDGVPARAPSPDSLVQRLLTPESAPSNDLDAYLRAMGWMDHEGRTERGNELARRWLDLDPTDVSGWARWIADAGTDLDKIPRFTALLQLFHKHPNITDSDAATAMGDVSRVLQSRSVLANAFGRVVRLSAKSWNADGWSDDEADEAVLEGIRTLVEHSETGATFVAAAQVFTSFLPRSLGEARRPMSLPVFRAALARLARAGRIVPGGSAPGGKSSETIVHALERHADEPSVKHRKVNLRDGDFLIPGVPCAVVSLS